eukprot:m.177277 g.177277  ORF g.177277 m.177277 type:complete len:90 (-) comp14632_c0_seq40:1801-2070(-)
MRDETEFAHKDTVLRAAEEGVISLFLGFSEKTPDGTPPIMLDALLEQHAQEIWDLFQKGGHMYICGGASVSSHQGAPYIMPPALAVTFS